MSLNVNIKTLTKKIINGQHIKLSILKLNPYQWLLFGIFSDSSYAHFINFLTKIITFWLFFDIVVTFDNGLGQSADQLPIIQIAITDESIKRPGFLPKAK